MSLVEDFTGQDARLLLNDTGTGETEITVSNVSLEIEANTTDVQHNNSLNPTHATTGVRYSGSFEYDGVDVEIFGDMIDKFPASDVVEKPAEINTLSIREENSAISEGSGDEDFDRNIIVSGIQVTSISRDTPGDDVTSVSVDFVAEQVTMIDGQS